MKIIRSTMASSWRTAAAEPMPSQADVTRVRATHVAVLLALCAAQIGCGVWTSIASSDTNRDIFFAQQIASGAFFPLIGPPLNGMLHLGPLWYYLLAIPLCLIPNAASVTGFMATISALQFPLAYELGRQYRSAREGLLFAVALALPGWMTVSLASMTHSIAVVPSLLLGVFAALKYRDRPDAKHAAYLGLACVFMLTAHPTLVLLAFFLVLWCAAATPARIQWLGHGLIVAGLVMLSLAPLLYAQWHGDVTDAATTAKYMRSDWSAPSLLKAGPLLHAILYFGPKYAFFFLLELAPRPARILLLIYLLMLATAGIGLAMRLYAEREERGLICLLSALLLMQSVFVCAIRADMPPWMIYAQWPLVAALIALGLERICAGGSKAKALVAAGLLVTTLCTFDVYAHLASAPLDHVEMKPSPGKSGAMDIRDYEKSRYRYRLARVPFRQLFALGDPLCRPVVLFGHYAYLIDYTYAVSAHVECGEADTVQFGGIPPPGNARCWAFMKAHGVRSA